MKRLISVILTICIFLCSCSTAVNTKTAGDFLKITAVNFPLYDFAKQITGDSAEVIMLLPPGSESHTFDPKPSDIVNIETSDLFIYIGGDSDHWAKTLIESSDSKNLTSLSLIDKVLNDSSYRSHDEHIWTSPELAIKMCQLISEEIIKKDEKNADTYRLNTEKLISEISLIDKEIRETANVLPNKTLIFGDRFPFAHFANCYGFDYLAAFDDCGAHSEPGAKKIAELIDKINSENIKSVFYIEFSNKKTAEAISRATGAVPILFHSCHNVTKDELKSGVSYVSLMRQNIEALKKGLN